MEEQKKVGVINQKIASTKELEVTCASTLAKTEELAEAVHVADKKHAHWAAERTVCLHWLQHVCLVTTRSIGRRMCTCRRDFPLARARVAWWTTNNPCPVRRHARLGTRLVSGDVLCHILYAGRPVHRHDTANIWCV